MRTKKWWGVILCGVILAESAVLAYSWYTRQHDNDFTCVASLSQHYNNESYNVSLNYMVRGNSGVINMNGYSEEDPGRIFNRKISFTLHRKGDLNYMVSVRNIKFPDDNLDDEVLSQYEPDFFVFAGKEIYMRILKQRNDNYLFMLDSIPTYICNNISETR